MSLLDRTRNIPIFHSGKGLLKKADVDLGENSHLWFAKIYGAFEGQHPEVLRPDSAPSLTFDQQDFGKGFALGAVSVGAGPNLLIFPVIIRNNKLAPFDLVFVNGNLRYADKGMLQALAHPYRPFVGRSTASVGRGPNTSAALHNDQLAGSGRTVLGSAQEIDVMADLEERVRPISYTLEAEENLSKSAGFEFDEIKYSIAQDQIYKWAQLSMESPEYYLNGTNEFRAMFDSLSRDGVKTASAQGIWYDIASVERSDINKYITKIAKRGYDGFVEIIMDSDDVRKIAEEFDQDGDAVLGLADKLSPEGGVLLSKEGQAIQELSTMAKTASEIPDQALSEYMVNGKIPTFDIPGLVHNYGTYNVLFASGDYDTGIVFNMVDWNFKKDSNYLFVGSKYAIQERMAGQPSSTSFRAPRGEPNEGTVGTFVYESSGTGFAIPPFEVSSYRSTPRGLAIKAQGIMDGKPLNLVPVEGVKSLVKITRENDPEVYVDGCVNVYVPASMQFIVLPPERGSIIPDPQQAIKLSSWRNQMLAGPSSDVRVSVDADNRYQLDMVSFPLEDLPGHISKTSGFRLLDRRPSRLLDVAFSLKVAGLNSPYELVDLARGYTHSINIPIKSASKISNLQRDRDYSSAWYEIYDRVPREALYKIASVTMDKKTLDEVFSLNFINKDNLKYFMSNLGLLKDVEEYLARLLLAARVSDIGVDEDEISGALEDVSHIREVLSRKQILAGE